MKNEDEKKVENRKVSSHVFFDFRKISFRIHRIMYGSRQEVYIICQNVRKHQKICIALGILLAAVLLYFILFWYPHHEIHQFGITDPKDLADAENSYRATLAQILGGVVVSIGLYYTWRRVTIAEESQVTERFTRAIEQLGNQATEDRLGGIYALGRIADESKRDYWPIIDILTAYVRMNSNCQFNENDMKTELMTCFVLDEGGKGTKNIEVRKVSSDIQAALAVIGKYEKKAINGEINKLRLFGAYLQGADLSWTHFEEVDFRRANLKWANLSYGFFNRTFFGEVHLEKANLANSIFTNASFTEAHMEGAFLNGTHLEWAYFKKANLEGANFRGAHLENAYFEGTCLKGVKNLTIDQLSKVQTLHNTQLDEELRTQLTEKYPRIFDECIPKVNAKLILDKRLLDYRRLSK